MKNTTKFYSQVTKNTIFAPLEQDYSTSSLVSENQKRPKHCNCCGQISAIFRDIAGNNKRAGMIWSSRPFQSSRNLFQLWRRAKRLRRSRPRPTSADPIRAKVAGSGDSPVGGGSEANVPTAAAIKGVLLSGTVMRPPVGFTAKLGFKPERAQEPLSTATPAKLRKSEDI